MDGALATVVPVAAHIPGGGFASISFPVAVRIILEIDDAVVEVRAPVFVEGGSAAGLDEVGLRMPSGCGNGTGVGVLLLEAMVAKDGYSTVLSFVQRVAPGAAQCVSLIG